MKLQGLVFFCVLAQLPTSFADSLNIIQRVALTQIDGEDANVHPIPAFKPIFLRHNGRWNESESANAVLKRLDADSLATIASYIDYGIESLAADNNGRFVARVSFAYGRETQVNVVAGGIQAADPKDPTVAVTKYADVDQGAVSRREDLMTFDNIFNPGRNFQVVKEQVQAEDKARARAAEAVLRVWLVSVSSNVLAEASTAK